LLLKQEAEEKVSLEKMIRDMEQKLVIGGKELEDKEKE
jgi:hypothetical protein